MGFVVIAFWMQLGSLGDQQADQALLPWILNEEMNSRWCHVWQVLLHPNEKFWGLVNCVANKKGAGPNVLGHCWHLGESVLVPATFSCLRNFVIGFLAAFQCKLKPSIQLLQNHLNLMSAMAIIWIL